MKHLLIIFAIWIGIFNSINESLGQAQELTINARVYLEGAIFRNGNEVGTTHNRPLMRDDLRVNPFDGHNYIPISDPYSGYSDSLQQFGNYTLFSSNAEALAKYNFPSQEATPNQFLTIPDPATVFSVTGEDAIVDWIWLELRSKTNDTLRVARRSALLQRDGDVVDLDGVSKVRFPELPIDSYYLVIRHRNHLGVMSANPLTPARLDSLVDFTIPNIEIYDKGVIVSNNGTVIDYTGLAQKQNVKLGYYGLWAGDADGSGKVKHLNDGSEIQSQSLTYISNLVFGSNFDFANGYRNGDFDMNGKVKFSSPNSDFLHLKTTVIFNPNNIDYSTSFDAFIEQLPERQILGN